MLMARAMLGTWVWVSSYAAGIFKLACQTYKTAEWDFLGATAVGKCCVKHLQEPHDFFSLQHLNRATFVLWKFVARFRLQTQ
jgi:hypothetical protein